MDASQMIKIFSRHDRRDLLYFNSNGDNYNVRGCIRRQGDSTTPFVKTVSADEQPTMTIGEFRAWVHENKITSIPFVQADSGIIRAESRALQQLTVAIPGTVFCVAEFMNCRAAGLWLVKDNSPDMDDDCDEMDDDCDEPLAVDGSLKGDDPDKRYGVAVFFVDRFQQFLWAATPEILEWNVLLHNRGIDQVLESRDNTITDDQSASA